MMSRRKLLSFLAIVLLFSSCDRDRNHPGWDYFPDMAYAIPYETNSPNPNFANGSTMRTPVKGTVPREITPFPYTKDSGEIVRAGRELMNPLKPTEDVLKRGKVEFTRFCSICHGIDGNGDGELVTRGLYPAKPKSLVDKSGKALKEGEIYYTIMMGYGSMGSYGAQVRPGDRWKIITYITQVLQKNFKEPADTVKQN